MIYLRELTAASFIIGPFVDSTDGVTAETALTLNNNSIRLSKNGGAFAGKNASDTAVHKENGYYGFNLSVTDLNTCGVLLICGSTSGALPVWDKVIVMSSIVYDSLVLGTDRLQVDAREIEGADPTDTIRDSVVDDATRIDGSEVNGLSEAIAALNDLSAAEVNAEVVDALNVDTYGELTSLPGASPTLKGMIMFLYMISRNKVETTSSQKKLYRDDGSTVLGTWAVSDNGTTFTQGEVA